MRVLVLAVLLAACGAARADHAMKGWELYHGEGPVFGLLVGTNRQKSDSEIRDALHILGWEKLEERLATLARGDAILVQGTLGEADRKRLAELCAKHELALQ